MSLVQKYCILVELHPDFGVQRHHWSYSSNMFLLFSYPMDVRTLEARVPIEFRGVELFFKIESSFSKLFFEQSKDKVKTLLLTFVAFCSRIERYGSMLESEILTLHPHSWKLLICQGNCTFINPNLKLHTHGFRQISICSNPCFIDGDAASTLSSAHILNFHTLTNWTMSWPSNAARQMQPVYYGLPTSPIYKILPTVLWVDSKRRQPPVVWGLRNNKQIWTWLTYGLIDRGAPRLKQRLDVHTLVCVLHKPYDFCQDPHHTHYPQVELLLVHACIALHQEKMPPPLDAHGIWLHNVNDKDLQ